MQWGNPKSLSPSGEQHSFDLPSSTHAIATAMSVPVATDAAVPPVPTSVTNGIETAFSTSMPGSASTTPSTITPAMPLQPQVTPVSSTSSMLDLDNAEETLSGSQLTTNGAARTQNALTGVSVSGVAGNKVMAPTGPPSQIGSVVANPKGAASFTIRKPNRPGSSQPLYSVPTPIIPAPASTGDPTPASAAPTPIPAFPALHLTPLNDTFVPKQISLSPPGTRVKIGRQTNAKTVPNGINGYFDSKVLSRMHAEVWSEDGKVFIKDVKSSNGTFINGERLSAEAAESHVFELHTEDVVEFGIDIVSDDNKTIVHHKVAAKVHLVLNAEDVLVSSREFSNWYRAVGDAPMLGGLRRGSKAASTGQNGLASFENVLIRLQSELQKSKDTGNYLGDLTSTLNDVHETLGGAPPTSLANFPTHPSRIPPYIPGNVKDSHGQSIAALQSQLNETQNSLAGQEGSIRDLEGVLAEHEMIKKEVGTFRQQMEESQRQIENLVRTYRAPSSKSGGRESVEDRQVNFYYEDDQSTVSEGTVRHDSSDQKSSPTRANDHAFSENGALYERNRGGDSLTGRERLLEDQNGKLAARLEELSLELEAATRLGNNLRSQHTEAASAVRTLEERVQRLEKTVEDRVAEAEVRILHEAKVTWKGWKDAFEESWNSQRRTWEVERDELSKVVRDWQREREGSQSGTEDESDVPENNDSSASAGNTRGESTFAGSVGHRNKKSKPRKKKNKSNHQSTLTNRPLSAASPALNTEDSRSSELDADDVHRGKASGSVNWNGSGPGRARRAGLSDGGVQGVTQHMSYSSATAVVLVGVAAVWALSVKLKE